MFEGLRFKHWSSEQDADRIVVLTIDRAGSSVNTFAREVLEAKAKADERFARRFQAIVEKHDKNLYGG